MTALEHFISPALTRALGWTLLHSLWQGALVAAVLAGALLLLRRQRAEVRYVASAGALGMVVALAGITFGLYYNAGANNGVLLTPEAIESVRAVPMRQAAEPASSGGEGTAETGVTAATAGAKAHLRASGKAAPSQIGKLTQPATPNWLAAGLRYFDQHLPLLVVAWVLGLLAMSLRLLGGLLYVQRLRRYRVRPLGKQWEERLAALARRSGVRRPVALLESALVRVPLVVGHVRPVILLPLGAVAGLSPAYLEAILAHELAHVLRRDYLVNLLQTVAEALFFYHPAVWFVANCVRTERENCCDDTATALVGGDPLRLALALTALAEWSQSAVVTTSPQLALAAMGGRGALLSRVRRLVQRRPAAPTVAEGLMAGALVLGGLGLLGGSVAVAVPLAKATLPTASGLGRPKLTVGLGQGPASPVATNAPATAGATDTVRGQQPAGRGAVVITRDKKGRLTSLVVNGQPVALPAEKLSKAERRAGRQVTVVPVPNAGPERRSRTFEYNTRTLDRAGREGDKEGRKLDAHARELDRAGRELDKAGRKLDKMGRELDQAAQKIDRKSGGTYTYDKSRRTGTGNSNVHLDIDEAALSQLVNNALQLGNVGLNIGLQAASDGIDEARRSLEATLRDPSLSAEARRATRDALTELRQEQGSARRQNPDQSPQARDRAQAARDRRQEALDQAQQARDRAQEARDRTQETRDRRQEIQERIRESQQELRELDREQAGRRRGADEALVAELLKDGLIQDRNNFQLRLTARSLVIGGKEQPQKVFQKYLKLYESTTGRQMSATGSMMISRNGTEGHTSENGLPRPPRPPRAPRMGQALVPAPPAAPAPPAVVAPPAPPRPPRVDTRALRDEMRKDGLLGANDTSFQVQLNDAGLTVNGKRQSDELAAKYRQLMGHDRPGQSYNLNISIQD